MVIQYPLLHIFQAGSTTQVKHIGEQVPDLPDMNMGIIQSGHDCPALKSNSTVLLSINGPEFIHSADCGNPLAFYDHCGIAGTESFLKG